MAAYRGVPSSGLDIFPCRSALKIELAAGVEDMQVYYGVEQLASVVTFSAGGGSSDVSLFVYYREHFLIIVACYSIVHYFIVIACYLIVVVCHLIIVACYLIVITYYLIVIACQFVVIICRQTH